MFVRLNPHFFFDYQWLALVLLRRVVVYSRPLSWCPFFPLPSYVPPVAVLPPSPSSSSDLPSHTLFVHCPSFLLVGVVLHALSPTTTTCDTL